MPLQPANITAPPPVDEIPASPPPDVLAAIEVAATAYDRLREGGRTVHFDLDAATGRLTVQILDDGGAVTGTVSPSRVLELAAGEALH